VNYFLFPSLYSEWVYTGDVLRVGFYLVLLGGAAREIHAYWRGLAQAAVQEERRRLARDLHDGLAQELAYIGGRASAVGADDLTAAAARALDESRRAIAALTLTREEPLDLAVAEAAEDVALRAGARVRLELAPGIRRPPAVQEALLRVVREAVTNAVRHGRAQVVRIDLSNGKGVRLRIADDGVGFDAAAGDGTGFGLVSMRERVAALGGELRLASRPGSGTAIEVLVP
jgi:signal transduction histidine kinase